MVANLERGGHGDKVPAVGRVRDGDLNPCSFNEFHHLCCDSTTPLFSRKGVDQKVNLLNLRGRSTWKGEHIGEYRAVGSLFALGLRVGFEPKRRAEALFGFFGHGPYTSMGPLKASPSQGEGDYPFQILINAR